MKNCIGPHVIEFADTGAPRGEKNLWYVRLNGVTIIESSKQAQARTVFDALSRALADGVAVACHQDSPPAGTDARKEDQQ